MSLIMLQYTEYIGVRLWDRFYAVYLRAVAQASGSLVFNQLLDTASVMQAGINVGADGSIYVCHQSDIILDGRAYSYSPQGDRNWTQNAGGYNVSPAIVPNGDIVFGGREVRAFTPDGSLAWEFDAVGAHGDSSFFSTAVDESGITYVGDWNVTARPERLYAIDPAGDLLWTFEDAGGSAAIGPDGTIYAGHKSTLYAINPDGTERWHFDHGPRGDASVSSEAPTIDAAGNVYVTNAQGILFSLNPDGQVRWTYDLAPSTSLDIFPSMPIIDSDGTLYVGTGYDAHLVALVPEPAASMLLVGGAILLWWSRRRT